jgi:hypothetical protein
VTENSLLALPPERAAGLLARDADSAWAQAFLRQFQRELHETDAQDDLDRFMSIWGVSAASVARVFAVSRQAIAKWRRDGVPADRSPGVADLGAATDVLARYLRHDRIPAVVRRPAEMLNGMSLLELAETGDTESVRRQVAAMFDLRRVAP